MIRYHELSHRLLELQYPELRGNGKNYIKGEGGKFAGSRPGSGSGGNSAKDLTTKKNSVIIKASKSNNPTTDKSLEYFSSAEYRNKFNEFGDNPLVTNSMYKCACDTIKTNYYTESEDAYLISSTLGIHGNPTHSDTMELTYSLPKNSKAGQYILIHNHPNNTPLSLADIVAASDRAELKRMVAVSHDGKIYYLEIGKGKRLSEFGVTQDAMKSNTQEWHYFEFNIWGKYVNQCKGNTFEALKLLNKNEELGWKVGAIE